MTKSTVSGEFVREYFLIPEMAAIEPLLLERQEQFRSLVVRKNYKVVYYIQNTTVFITDIWNCRQDPDNLLKPDGLGGSDPGDQVRGADHHQ